MTDDAIVARVLELVRDGEYRDELFGRPGENLDGAVVVRLDGGQLSSGRRSYVRGSAEYESAKRHGLVTPLPPLVPASADAIAAAEAELRHPLPSLLKRLYIEVGNGGFGPGYGILGVAGGFVDDMRQNAVEAFRSFQEQRGEVPVLLPICHWGCAIYSLVELAPEPGQMWGFDPNGADLEHALYPQGFDLASWIERWLDLALHQPAVVEDPDTGEWRGATDEEMAEWAAEFG